jgi:hypothetical protein
VSLGEDRYRATWQALGQSVQHGILWTNNALNGSKHSDIKELHFFHHIDFVQDEVMNMVDSVKR